MAHVPLTGWVAISMAYGDPAASFVESAKSPSDATINDSPVEALSTSPVDASPVTVPPTL